MTTSITRDELRSLVDAGRVTLVDALPASYYDQEHLPGAINLVEADVDGHAGALLPDAAATIVTYCASATCPNSEAVASRLRTLGYTDVRTYREGIADWVSAGYETESAVRA